MINLSLLGINRWVYLQNNSTYVIPKFGRLVFVRYNILTLFCYILHVCLHVLRFCMYLSSLISESEFFLFPQNMLTILLIYLVTACLEALKCVLPAPLVVQAHLACYALAQAPHCQDDGGEWAWFTRCVLDLMGYPPDDKAKVMGVIIYHWLQLSLNMWHQNMTYVAIKCDMIGHQSLKVC